MHVVDTKDYNYEGKNGLMYINHNYIQTTKKQHKHSSDYNGFLVLQ